MQLHDIKAWPGARKKSKRKGRGPGSGKGKTAGRGHKGQKSRRGASVSPYFEGGQTPLVRRVPKRGFTNIFAKEYAEVNVERLNIFEPGTEVTPQLLLEKKIIKDLKDGVKILGKGELKVALTVKAHKFSTAAKEKIEKAGGKAEVIG